MAQAPEQNEGIAGFLTDTEIIDLAKDSVKNMSPPLEDQFGLTSQIQPCSIDVTIGRIFLPGAIEKSVGSEASPIVGQHVLQPGQTAVVETAEEFHLPSRIAGIGFPPNRISEQGILLTNPGHIDPGYDGSMRFTVINMGHEAYGLECGKEICTVLLFRLAESPQKDYRQRRTDPPTSRQNLLKRLSPDFLDVTKRAEEIAETAADKARIKITSWQVWVPLFGMFSAIIAAAAGIIVNVFVLQSDLRSDVDSLESRLEVGSVQRQVDDLEDRLQGIEESQ